MRSGKVTGPSHFCEWVIGTTIPSILGPIPKQKKHRYRDVVRVEVTTDDESEEDTLKITYPRTGRTNSTYDNSHSTVKKVRFDEKTKDAPKKSALKKPKSPVDSDETSESDAESSKAGESEIESSDDAPRPAAKGKKQQKKKNVSSDDTDSEYDSDPHPTCKKQAPPNGKGNIRKRPNESDTDAETSNSSRETSGSEPEKSPKAKNQSKNRSTKKKEEPKSEESSTDAEASGSEPETLSKVKKQEATKSNKKKGGKQTNASDTDVETSESAKETDEETNPAKKTNDGKSGSGKKNGKQAQAQKQKKKPENEINDQDKSKEEEQPAAKEQGKSKKGKKVEESETEYSKMSKRKGETKRGNYPEALLYPHPRRPNLIEPIRAEVVQTERVVETPEDPAPNAYYDQEHNIVRVYYGPVYGNHHSNALYPSRTANTQPLPMGITHPTQNPYYYGFNNNQPLQAPPPQGYGYSHAPITQGLPAGPWNAVAPPPGFPPGYTGQPINQMNSQEMQRGGDAYMMSGGAGFPPSNKEKDKDGVNNVGPEESKNPYLPTRPKSQFSTYGSAGRRNASRETRNSGKGDGQPASNPAWSNNDGAGEQQGTWGDNNADSKSNEWGQTNNSQKEKETWGCSAKNSHTSHDTMQKKQGSHWGEDTHLQSKYGPDDWKQPQDQSGESEHHATGWENDQPRDDKANSIPGGNVMPGSWVETRSAPAWGDPSAAADTGGQVEGW
ncbi:hypothetical protein G7Z17_g4884 [Cylindrodendrum hubeiense]|uniref:Uncharacterized protein n=1 Tax=Cylindrodendrum hubeiense TaxID=595255 RepID=A0A9P5H832_9HYPO|nr:hypothetical protein G7Z17_g4884 [Cylindrodendrum hubeiense]